jgi:hypothetical protein
MAQIVPRFELSSSGSVTFSGTETWVDLTSFAPDINSPIPSGKQIWIAYVTCIAQDKAGTFELRPNLPTKSAGNITDTQLRGFTTVASGTSEELDVYYGGATMSLAPVTAVSTGVEKLWLRIRSGSNSSGSFDFIMYYTIY